MAVEEVGLHGGEERFRGHVFSASLTRRSDTSGPRADTIRSPSHVFRAVIAMGHRSECGPATPIHDFERVDNKLGAEIVGDGMFDDEARVRANDSRTVDPDRPDRTLDETSTTHG